MCMAELSPAATDSVVQNQKIPDHLSKDKALKKQIEKKLAWESLIVTANISQSPGL